MENIVCDVIGAKVHPGNGGRAIRCRFEIVDPESKPRQPSGAFCTLTMLREDAEKLLDELQTALRPPTPLSGLNA
jgi:hypothetical protein